MKSKKETIKAKGQKVKESLKKKLKGVATAAGVVVLLASMCGCQQLIPATRSNSTRYQELVRIEAGGHVSAIHITIGDGTLASADGGGDTQANTPTQTISPTTTLSYGMGGGESLKGLVSQLKSAIGIGATTATTAAETSATAATTNAACADGTCATPK